MKTARVIANHGSELTVINCDEIQLAATARKKFGLIVVGDQVQLADTPETPARVVELLPRQCTLTRTDRSGKPKPLAANITQLVIVCAPHPPFDLLLIDQYLVAAQVLGVRSCLVINKADQLTAESQQQARNIAQNYAPLGVSVLQCTAISHTDPGLNQLRAQLTGEISILVGQSGVGKSTLLATLLQDPSIRTGALSEQSGLGRHTTTVAHWYPLPDRANGGTGGAIIDSAGVRQFGQHHLSKPQVAEGFTEIAALAAHCRFHNCEHSHEPNCAVKDALLAGAIWQSRFENYCTLRERAIE